MLLAEEQARTKWCPKALSANGVEPESGNVSVNRVFQKGGADRDCLCLASDCMAWRWEMGFDHMPFGQVFDAGTEPMQPTGKGYCGLAGRVEG